MRCTGRRVPGADGRVVPGLERDPRRRSAAHRASRLPRPRRAPAGGPARGRNAVHAGRMERGVALDSRLPRAGPARGRRARLGSPPAEVRPIFRGMNARRLAAVTVLCALTIPLALAGCSRRNGAEKWQAIVIPTDAEFDGLWFTDS